MQRSMKIPLALLAAALIGGVCLWISHTGDAPERVASGPSPITFASQTAQLLRPSVISAVTKLGQGRPAIAGLPTTDTFELPVLRVTPAGVALQIPASGLPGKAHSRPLSAAESAGLAGAGFDLYSWSEGTLQATSPVGLQSGKRSAADAPDALRAIVQERPNQDLLVVIPPNTPGLAPHLNPHDAYIAVLAAGT